MRKPVSCAPAVVQELSEKYSLDCARVHIVDSKWGGRSVSCATSFPRSINCIPVPSCSNVNSFLPRVSIFPVPTVPFPLSYSSCILFLVCSLILS